MEINQIIVLVLVLSIISIVSAVISITMSIDAMKDYKKYLVKKADPEFQRQLKEENERFIKELEAQFQAERENDGDETT